jgi:hypothetical protein
MLKTIVFSFCSVVIFQIQKLTEFENNTRSPRHQRQKKLQMDKSKVEEEINENVVASKN